MTPRGVLPSRSVLCGDTPRPTAPPKPRRPSPHLRRPSRPPTRGRPAGWSAAARRAFDGDLDMRRLALPLLLALSSLAFAPAPLPRPDREAASQKRQRELAALARRLDELGVRWRVVEGP